MSPCPGLMIIYLLNSLALKTAHILHRKPFPIMFSTKCNQQWVHKFRRKKWSILQRLRCTPEQQTRRKGGRFDVNAPFVAIVQRLRRPVVAT